MLNNSFTSVALCMHVNYNIKKYQLATNMSHEINKIILIKDCFI